MGAGRKTMDFFHGVYGSMKTLVDRKKEEITPGTENCTETELDSHPPSLGSHPWLVFSHGVGRELQTFFSISENRDYVRSMRDMTNKFICTCSHGWLVMSDVDTEDCFLLNSVSLKKIELPPLKKFSSWSFCVLSSTPDDPKGCLVVFFLPEFNYLMFCRPNDKYWVREHMDYEISCAIGCGGKIYAIGNPPDLLEVIPGSGKRLLIEDLPFPSRLKKQKCYTFSMVEACGEIFVVRQLCWQIYKPRVRDIEIFKVNLSTLDWGKVESLGDHAFFIDSVNFYGFSCLASGSSGIKRNSVYLLGNEGLYIFDLGLKNISLSLPRPDLSFEGQEIGWIMPVASKDEEENTQAPPIGSMVEEEIKYEAGNGVSAPSPCLMFSSMNSCNINLFFPERKCTYKLKLEEELSDTVICFLKGGWLLLVQDDHNMFFLNPITKEKISIISFPHWLNFDAICFTSPPTSSDCTIFGIYTSGLYKVKIFILRLEEKRWDVKTFKSKRRWWDARNCIKEPMSFSSSESNPVFHDGLFYCLDEKGKVGCFDPERNTWTVFRTSWSLCVTDYDQNFLVECDENLIAVVVGPLGSWIRVLRLDLSKKSKMYWKDINSLGDWMLFVSERTCFSKKATVKGTGNKIYLQRFHANHGVFYCLETKKYHTFDNSHCREDFCGTTEEIQCTWMML